ncbi:hypothetical protein ALC60_04484 [Trachymyrmex zeteki]|uniref:Uncharacterized protein n=1 Tax=Mycetomoellerius zeteki TaxID=64791 RepID=A0A151X8L4_9HYME|nr:hypothetical protein ALC60_04484 [Trachymyrmex zeteki]
MRVEMISTPSWRQLLWIDRDLYINHVHRQKKVISAAC